MVEINGRAGRENCDTLDWRLGWCDDFTGPVVTGLLRGQSGKNGTRNVGNTQLVWEIDLPFFVSALGVN